MADAEAKMKISVAVDDQTNGALEDLGRKVGGLESSFKKLGGGLAAFFAVDKIAQFTSSSIEAFDTSIQYATKLEFLLKKNTAATDENVKALNDQAQALQEIGVIEDDVATALQGQLATFELNYKTISKMTPAILDMVVAEKGVNATTEDMISFGNAFGMAMEGNYAALTKRGFKLDENTKKIIELGTEEQKADAITKYLTDTYGGFNEQMAKTSQGSMMQLKNDFGDIQENFGALASFLRNEVIDSFVNVYNGMQKFFTETLGMTDDWTKEVAFKMHWLGKETEAALGVAYKGVEGIVASIILEGDKSMDEETKKLAKKYLSEDYTNQINAIINSASYEKVSTDFEQKWKKLTSKVGNINPLSSIGSGTSKVSDEMKKEAERVEKAFTDMAKTAVSSFRKEQEAIYDLKEAISDLDKQLQDGLDKSKSKYEQDVINLAKSSKERIDAINKQIEEERSAMNDGWRTKIKELEAQKAKEQSILDRANTQVTNLSSEIAKDDLRVLQEKHIKELSEIRTSNEEKKKALEDEMKSREMFLLKNVQTVLGKNFFAEATSKDQTFLKDIGASKSSNMYNFNFNEVVAGDDGINKIIAIVINQLNRTATLKGYGGQ